MKGLNKKGSTVVTAIVIVMIIFILLTTALFIAKNYEQRSINDHAKKQAYLNGISVADVIAGQIKENNAMVLPEEGQSERQITNVTLPEGYGGEVPAVVRYDIHNDNINKNIVFIEVTSTYNKQIQEIQLTLQYYNNEWYKKAYSKIGERFDHE